MGALVVDDEADLRLLVRLAIDAHNEGLHVAGEASSGQSALDQLAALDPTVVVLDQMMPGMDGLETAERILAIRPDQPILLFSAFVDDHLEQAARRSGVTACLRKDHIRRLPDLLMDLTASAP